MYYRQYFLGMIACAPMQVAPASSQEVARILDHKEWHVGGVCVGVNECGFCSVTNSLHQDVQLRIAPPKDVSVELSGKHTKLPVILEIGSQTFNLNWKDADDFAADDEESSKIVLALQHEKTLTLRVGGGTSAVSYHYSLAEYPKVYAALAKACRIPNH